MESMECAGLEKTWHMCYYFKWGTSDWLSRQMMDFKRGDKTPIEVFANLAGEAIGEVGQKFDMVIRVLGSNELRPVQGARLAAVTRKLSEVLGCRANPNLIQKNRVTRELKRLGKEARKKELEGVYEIYRDEDLNGKKILIVDDIFTFGTSFEAIAEILKAKYPAAELYGFALAKTWTKGEMGIETNTPGFVDRYKAEWRRVSAK